jgi:hypothetical protein
MAVTSLAAERIDNAGIVRHRVCSGVVTVLVTVMTPRCASSYGQSLTGLGSRSHQWGPNRVARQHPS